MPDYFFAVCLATSITKLVLKLKNNIATYNKEVVDILLILCAILKIEHKDVNHAFNL
jgi:hypothetical protein